MKQQNHSAPPEGLTAGRNPVIELLKSGRPVDRILMVKEPRGAGSLSKIAAMAREQGIPVKETTREALDALCGELSHQGVAAFAAAFAYADVDELWRRAEQAGEPLFVVVADGIEDPHNLGAIIRTADAAGAHGLIIPKRHGVGLTPAVLRASAGAAEHLPVARVSNLVSCVERLKEQGVWVYAADMAGQRWDEVDFSGPAALVIGSEGQGVSRLMKERSDVVVSLPMRGKVNSLNASVAAGILMYEIARQRVSPK